MIWRGFTNQFIDNAGKKNFDVQVHLNYDYQDLQEVKKKFLEEAKKLGSEEQLEMWISDIVDYVYSIGYNESRIDIIQMCSHPVQQQQIVEYYTNEIEDDYDEDE